MGIFVNPDNSAFQVALNSEIYIDKTGLLEYTNKVMNTLQGYICNSRPRRFGKSITANMLTAYYSKGCESEKMFSGLEISEYPDFRTHLNQYDVIHLDIQWCMEPAGGAQNVVSYITEQTIKELGEYYPGKVPEDIRSLPEVLSRINHATGNKFIVIIDEWDVLIRDKNADEKVQAEYIDFLRGMFKGTEPTKYIQLAYLTGILPIKKEKTQSALNNFDEFTMLSAGRLSPYIGFTEEEVQKLAKEYSLDYDKVKKWYDGLKTAIIEMLSGSAVKVNTATFKNDTASIQSKDDVLTYMIHLGYLGYDQNTKTAFVPNEEIRQELTNAVESKKWNEMLIFQQESEELLNATLDLENEVVAEQIEKIHDRYISAIQYNNENSLSSVLAIAYLSSMQYYFKPVRELPTGRGFADFVYIPKPEYRGSYPALIVELKWNKNVSTALQQIKEKEYPESVLDYTGDILLVAVSYDKKSREHQCLIEQYEKS